jgi:hypothetical protein
MTPNDAEIDVLLRRFARVASDVRTTDHLDADELNAFAEGALPAAARSRYVSHLADCDDCRRVVTELAAASGGVEKMAVPASQPTAPESWWQKIGSLFAPNRLRFAAFAAMLVAVVSIGFAVWRKSQEQPSGVVPQNGPAVAEDVRTASHSQEPSATGVASEQSPAPSAIAKAIPQPTPAPFADQKQQQTTDVSPPPPPKSVDTLARNDTAPSSAAAGRAAEPSSNAGAPAYAPPPTVETERAETRNREQQNLGLIHGPQRGESNEKFKGLDDRARGAGDSAKARDEDRARTGSDQPAAKEESKNATAARKRSESRTATLASRPAAGVRQEEPKSDKAAPPEEADTRTVNGRKFKRQGNVWIDVKLKSSMSIKTISRGTDEFEKLDGGLRSISQQFSGPIIVVWKDKAYRIQ